MTTATGLTVQLYQSLDGLAVEVTGLPLFSPIEHIDHARKREMAAAELKRQYPEFLIRRYALVNSDGMVFWVERI